jgi:hypothetical protein
LETEIKNLLEELKKEIDPKSLENKKETPSVSYSKLYSLGTKSDKCIMYMGWVTAFLAGLVIPGFCWFVGTIADTFNPYNTGY